MFKECPIPKIFSWVPAKVEMIGKNKQQLSNDSSF